MTMYLVCADDLNGNNQDQYVCANSTEEAYEMWALYQTEGGMERLDEQFGEGTFVTVYEVPGEGRLGVQEWPPVSGRYLVKRDAA